MISYSILFMGISILYVSIQHILWLPSHDVALYAQYAQDFLRAHHFAPEYPPLAMGIFLLTQLVPAQPYFIFGSAMIIAIIIVTRFALVLTSRRRMLAVVGYTMLGLIPMVVSRYDVIPALLKLMALSLARRQRWSGANLLLCLGALVKVYPVVLIPVIMIAQWQGENDARVSVSVTKLGKALTPSLVFVGVIMSLA